MNSRSHIRARKTEYFKRILIIAQFNNRSFFDAIRCLPVIILIHFCIFFFDFELPPTKKSRQKFRPEKVCRSHDFQPEKDCV